MNNYDLLVNVAEDGMTDELWSIVFDDKQKLSSVKNDRERNLYFYLENFIDDLCEEFKCSNVNKDEILLKSFLKLKGNEKVDLTDIRHAVFNSINETKKVAYPNTKGRHLDGAIPEVDMNKWIGALNEVYHKMNSGITKIDATKQATEGWSPMEKVNFDSWIRYYENKDHEKYGQKKIAEPQIPSFYKKPVSVEELKNEIIKKGPGRPKNVERTIEQEKELLIQKLDYVTKALRKFVNVWPPETWQRLSGMLDDIRREIVPLKTTATIIDCIIKVANKFERFGFIEGANALIKIAQPGDIASQIEKALSGKNPEGDAPALDPGMPPGDLGAPPPDMGAMPPGGDLGAAAPAEAPTPTGMESMMSPPAGVEEPLPPAETPPPPPPEEPKEQPKTNGENPFKGQNITIQDVLDVLEPISKQLSEREFARSLSKVDMMLDSLNIASHFPELSQILSKALEMNIYIGTRVEEIIGKLKGGLKGDGEKKENTPAPPEVDMGEFSAGKPKEKEMFEVTEPEVAPTPPAPETAPKV